MLKLLEKISTTVSKLMALIVIAVAALALFVPQSCNWIKTSSINWLLGIVMFGMGLTLKPSDFKVVFSRPLDIIICFFAIKNLIKTLVRIDRLFKLFKK